MSDKNVNPVYVVGQKNEFGNLEPASLATFEKVRKAYLPGSEVFLINREALPDGEVMYDACMDYVGISGWNT